MRSKYGESYFEDPYYFAQTLSANIANASLRTIKVAPFKNLLTTMESILSQSAVLLRSASALLHSLIRGQALAEILRLESDDTLFDTDTEYSRQDLDDLLEPCGMVTPLGSGYKRTLQVQKSSDSLALGPSLSPLRSIQMSTSRQLYLRDRTNLGTPTASFSGLISPAKCGISPLYTNLSSPTRLPTPAVFNDAWVATDLRTPSIVSPMW